MEENTYCVYMHTLKVDGRKYIGITCRRPNKRWRNGDGYKKQPYFYNAIKKYGWDSFKHEIIFENLTKDQACVKEKALIKLFHTAEHDFGFNSTLGGEHYEFSDEVLDYLKIKASKHAINISKEELEYQYLVLNKSQKECGKYFGCSAGPVKRLLNEYNLSKSQYQLAKPITKVDLEYQYVILSKTQQECADYFTTSRETIRAYLKKFNLYMPKTWHKRFKSEQKYKISREDLYQQYIILGKSLQECANYFNCSVCVIQCRLKKYNIIRIK